MIESGGNAKLEVTIEDLMQFADRLIEKTIETKVVLMSQGKEGEWLTASDTKRIFNVTVPTLSSWCKIGYLRVMKIGDICLYARADIVNILCGGNKPSFAEISPLRNDNNEHSTKDYHGKF